MSISNESKNISMFVNLHSIFPKWCSVLRSCLSGKPERGDVTCTRRSVAFLSVFVFGCGSAFPNDLMDSMTSSGFEEISKVHDQDFEIVEQGVDFRCDLQKLNVQARKDGLWILSSSDEGNETFRIKAASLGRDHQIGTRLPDEGVVSMDRDKVRYNRSFVVEEYSVSAEGVRQDFIVKERPAGYGAMILDLDLSGANAESSPDGIMLELDRCGRRIAYHKLRVSDSTGRVLPAGFRVRSDGISVMVDDTAAVYPVTVDPTFSDADWVGFTGSTGPDYDVHAMVVDASGNLYVAGDFVRFGGMEVNRIVKWDGNRWLSLAGGVNGLVRCLAVSGTDLYAGGDFTEAGGVAASHVAKWTGTGWQALGKGTDKSVCAMAVMQGDLYAGGIFSKAGDVSVSNLAKWSGGSWSDIGGVRGFMPVVYSLAASGDSLYVGGMFSSIYDEISPAFFYAGGIAKYSRGTWSALDYGMWVGPDAPVFSIPVVKAMMIRDGELYVGGYFDGAGQQANGSSCQCIARWDGVHWNPLGQGTDIGVDALCAQGSTIYAGGKGGLRKWNGSAWSNGPIGIGGHVLAMAASSAGLYVGGNFTSAAGSMADRLSLWNGTKWSAPGGGVSLDVHAVAKDGESIYAAGSFTTAGGVEAQHVAKWNGSGWTAIGAGMNGQVNALAVWRGRLYAGGDFTMAGSGAASNLAQWDGTSWSAVGTGLNAPVHALLVWNDQLFVGGWFTQSGDGVPLGSVAKWNGSSWSPLGSGTDGPVFSLAAAGGGIYAGGAFEVAGDTSARMVAFWNGTSWQALGGGLGGFSWFRRVNTLCVGPSGSLYAGGLFDSAGGIPVSNLARWNGSSWSGIGAGGADAVVNALAVSGNHLYVGGGFSAIQGQPFSGIACWDGLGWSQIGSGAGGPVNALLVSGNRLHVGGAFTNAGNRGISGLAAITIPVPPSVSSVLNATARVGTSFSYQIVADNNPTSFSAQLAPALPSPGPGMPGGGSNLPAGLSFNPLLGLVSGTPSTAGTYQLLLGASNSAGTGTAILTLVVDASSPVVSWAQAAGLTGSNAEPTATPFNDGVSNLLKFAFNMNAGGPDSSVLGEGGSSGLPNIQVDDSGSLPVLRVQFLRRRNSGLVYVPERATSLDSFAPMSGIQTVTPIDDTWERVDVVETAPSKPGTRSEFARVRVTLP